MTTEEKKILIKEYITEMIEDSCISMKKNINMVLESGVIDIENWDGTPGSGRFVLPKTIVMALLNKESRKYSEIGTCFEKMIKKMVRKISYYL